MTKAKQVTVKIDVHTAAAVRQVLFDAQKGYTNDVLSVPSRIFNIREVIMDLDTEIAKIVE